MDGAQSLGVNLVDSGADERIPDVDVGVAADGEAEGLEKEDAEHGLLVQGVGPLAAAVGRAVALAPQTPDLDRLVPTPGEEGVLVVQDVQGLHGSGMAAESLQFDLLQVELGIRVVPADLVLPVGQPVALGRTEEK